MNNEQRTTEAFDNHRQACAKAIAACEVFIQMDINAPQQPVKAIYVGLLAELVEAKESVRETQERANKAKRDAESFRDMMPTSQELYDCE